MTDQERISREILLKRAAAVAGAVYVAPVLTSSAGAEAQACTGQRCARGKNGARKCRKKGGKNCRCIDGTCWGGKRGDCGPACCSGCQYDVLQSCDGSGVCPSAGPCVCVYNFGSGRCNCAAYPSYECFEYPRCAWGGNGSDCPPGTCCMQLGQGCGIGVCMAPCESGT